VASRERLREAAAVSPPRPLRILNVAEAPAGARRVSPQARGVAAADLSLTPCDECEARCCHMRVVVSLPYALRRSRLLDVDLLQSHVLSFRRDAGRCPHLIGARCDIYADRPANCRLFPFVVDDGHGVLAGGTQQHCPVQWLQDEELRASVAADTTRYREDRALELAIVRFWNRGRRTRTLPRLLAWLDEHVAEQLGLAPRVSAR
jgi:Fe-S-cluster containining protein